MILRLVVNNSQQTENHRPVKGLIDAGSIMLPDPPQFDLDINVIRTDKIIIERLKCEAICVNDFINYFKIEQFQQTALVLHSII